MSRPISNVGTDVGGRGVDEGDARVHQAAVNLIAKLGFHLRKLLARIDPGEFGGVAGDPGVDAQVAAACDRDDVGQVELVRRVVGADFAQRRPDKIGAGEIDSGVNLGNRALDGRGVAGLDDRGDLAAGVADHAAIRRRVGEFDADEGERGGAVVMVDDEIAERRRSQHRQVAVTDQNVAAKVGRQGFEGASRSVARAALVRLAGETQLCAWQGPARGVFDRGRLMADDDDERVDVESSERAQRPRDHRFAAEFVEDLGARRAHPRAESGSGIIAASGCFIVRRQLYRVRTPEAPMRGGVLNARRTTFS